MPVTLGRVSHLSWEYFNKLIDIIVSKVILNLSYHTCYINLLLLLFKVLLTDLGAFDMHLNRTLYEGGSETK